MHLKAFEVRNYRSFVEPARVELRPLTLLFGYNNAGKSALARVLPLLRDSLDDEEEHGLPLNLDSEAVRGAEFADLRSRQTGRRTIDLAFEFDGVPEIYRARLVLQDLPELRQHVVESFELESLVGQRLYGQLNLSLEGEDDVSQVYDLHLGGASGQALMDWQGLLPSLSKIKDGGALQETESLLDTFVKEMLDLEQVLWLGAIRSTQPRSEKFPRFKPSSIECDGAGAAEILVWDKQYGGALFTAVSSWYSKHVGAHLEVALRADEYALVMGAHQVSLSDTGEGLTQVMPVLVAGGLAAQRAAHDKPSYLVIEQPELHLHPAAHAPLAEFFCGLAAAASPPRMLIETHSENFLFGVQLAIAQGLLDPARVLIYWVQQDEQGSSTLTPIQMDADGRPDAWPKGVFTEEVELAKRLLEARRKKSAL